MRIDDSPTAARPIVAIAGATGFVGRALRRALAPDHALVSLTRSEPTDERKQDPATTWRRCDLFSLLDVERALEGVDTAIYLVHSMMPSARMMQANFADLDLILADNFARAARKKGVRRILYLGGLLPTDHDLSRHLESRLEVERALGSHGVPVTSLRAGLIVGAGGSSLSILVNLVRRLPAMVCPAWTKSNTQPIAIDDVVEAFRYCLTHDSTIGGAFDIGGPDVLTYREMLERTGDVLGRQRPTAGVPLLSPRLSKLWVSVFSGAPLALVSPLIESLRHDMLAEDNEVQAHLAPRATSFETALRRALEEEAGERVHVRREARRRKRVLRGGRKVRSVQRLPKPDTRHAEWVAAEYVRWLPSFCWPLLRVVTEGTHVASFRIAGTNLELLELTFSPERSRPDRQLFYVTGGLLARKGRRRPGRLEFREVLGGRHVLAAVHDFEPALPWHLYDLTQARAHLWVMHGFGRHLSRQPALPDRTRPPSDELSHPSL